MTRGNMVDAQMFSTFMATGKHWKSCQTGSVPDRMLRAACWLPKQKVLWERFHLFNYFFFFFYGVFIAAFPEWIFLLFKPCSKMKAVRFFFFYRACSRTVTMTNGWDFAWRMQS